MKAGPIAALLALLIGVAAAAEVRDPFATSVHAWWFALAVTLAGAYCLVAGAATALGGEGSRPAALAALGGALLAAAVAFAAFVSGGPARVPAAPGQTYRPPRSTNITVAFPSAVAGRWPASVPIFDGLKRVDASPGDVVRAGAFVFKVNAGPAALVDARTPAGQPVTITQPNAPAFLSDVLLFPGNDGDQPEDYFAVPALHRQVQVDYYAGLPARGIDIPFLALRISEENGGSLYEGVAVTGRQLREAGMTLDFHLGDYPIVTAASEPPVLPFIAGLAMVAFGCGALAIERGRARRAQSAGTHS